MRIAVLGTGRVSQTVAARLDALGHEVLPQLDEAGSRQG
jgi:Trk K+ transport system NAD-binding subunit